jgi:uncharacterized phage protein gp47/JayE
MSYQPPAITASGLSIPSYNDIYNYLIGQYQAIFGSAASTDNSNADVQLISIFALAASDMCQALQLEYNNRAPNFAIGAALDSIVSLNGLTRKSASFSTVQVTLTGTPGALITNGVVQDSVFNYLWDLPSVVTIGGGGTASATATCETSGAVNVNASTVTGIVTAQAGWTAVTNPSASVPGQPIEADSQLRTRQSLSVASPSQTVLAGTLSAIAAVSGVTRYNIDENFTNSTNSNGTPAHSITAVVEGGADADVANAIFFNRGLGCGTNGSTTINVTDPISGIVTPISFQRTIYAPIWVSIDVHLINAALANVTAAIQTALVNYIASLQIGQFVSYGEIVAVCAGAANPNPSQPVASIRSPLYLGFAPSPNSSADLAIAFNTAASIVATNVVVSQV